jgi:hypothetical protein
MTAPTQHCSSPAGLHRTRKTLTSGGRVWDRVERGCWCVWWWLANWSFTSQKTLHEQCVGPQLQRVVVSLLLSCGNRAEKTESARWLVQVVALITPVPDDSTVVLPTMSRNKEDRNTFQSTKFRTRSWRYLCKTKWHEKSDEYDKFANARSSKMQTDKRLLPVGFEIFCPIGMSVFVMLALFLGHYRKSMAYPIAQCWVLFFENSLKKHSFWLFRWTSRKCSRISLMKR